MIGWRPNGSIVDTQFGYLKPLYIFDKFDNTKILVLISAGLLFKISSSWPNYI